MKNNHISIFPSLTLKDRSDAYRFAASQMFPADPLKAHELTLELLNREEQGSIQIAEHVVLPHVEGNFIPETKVLVIKSQIGIDHWNSNIRDVRAMVFVFLKTDESKNLKLEIINIMRKLSRDNFIQSLLEETDSAAISKLFQESELTI